MLSRLVRRHFFEQAGILGSMSMVILYVPGLGDKKKWLLWLQKQALRTWRVRSVRVEILPMAWAGKTPFENRFKRLLRRIDDLHKAGHTVCLVGVSAGASATVIALVERPKEASGVVTICGKLGGDLPDSIKELNPCFAEAFSRLPKAIQRLTTKEKGRMLTLAAARDAVTPIEHATLHGVSYKKLALAGHNVACSYVLICKPRMIMRFLKSTTNQAP